MVEIPTETIMVHDELDADDLAFFKARTKIQDDDELMSHIATVEAEALKVYPFPVRRSKYVMTTIKII